METKMINKCTGKLKRLLLLLFLWPLISTLSSAQDFNSDIYYRIVAKHSGKVLDVAYKDQDNLANIIQHEWVGGDNQRWKIEPVGSGYYRIVAKHSGKVLDVAYKEQGNLANIIQHEWVGGDNQRWKFESEGNGYYRIIAKHSGKVLDVAYKDQDNLANIIQHEWVGGDNQRWKIEIAE